MHADLLTTLLEKGGIHLDHHFVHIVYAALIMVSLLFCGVIVKKAFSNRASRILPTEKASLSNLFEIGVGSILKLMEDIMGDRARQFFPLIGSIFIFIFISNVIGLIPGFVSPTGNINTNFAISLTVFLYYNFIGIKTQGVKSYLHHLMGPIIWLAPLMFVIELIGHLARPMSLAVRLYGNMTGDHMVLQIFSGLTPYVVPVIFLGLGLFVCFIQAFVFSLLTIIYISLATEVEHH